MGVANHTVQTGTGTSYSNPYGQVRVTSASLVSGALDPKFLAPATMSLTSTLGTVSVTNCTTRTATTFICTVGGVGATANGTLSAVLPSGLTVSATLTGVAIAAGSSRTLTLVNNAANPQPTSRFAPGLIWVNARPVSCEGYENPNASSQYRFTNCRGFGAVGDITGAISSQATSDVNKGLIGGYIKIEKQFVSGTTTAWADVTADILNLGIGAANQDGYPCGDPSPNAVLRIQRLRDNGNTGAATVQAGCPYGPSGAGSPTGTLGTSQNAHDWWPNALYDTREGTYRPGVATTGISLGGVMGYIALDVNNLKKWLAGATGFGTAGTNTLNVNGYIVYFSDRRGDHNENITGDPETGQYGFENVVNPPAADGSPTAAGTAILETGEDFNGNNTLDRWGETPHIAGILDNALTQMTTWTGSGYNAPFDSTARPWLTISAANAAQARMNRQVLFRRALKLVRGGIGIDGSGVTSMPANGLTVASENPVYVQGNYNASNNPVGVTESHVPAAVIADAVTILSNNWRDDLSFENPNSLDQSAGHDDGVSIRGRHRKVALLPVANRGHPAVPLRHGRRRRQLPADDGELANRERRPELRRLDGQPLLQSAGDGDVQVPLDHAHGLRLRRPELQVRRRVPAAGAAAARDADVPRHQPADVQADTSA